jgi:hypothetical protein
MTKLTTDPNRRVELPDPTRPLTICDEQGKYRRQLCSSGDGTADQPRGNRPAQAAKSKAYSTAEVLAHLEKL